MFENKKHINGLSFNYYIQNNFKQIEFVYFGNTEKPKPKGGETTEAPEPDSGKNTEAPEPNSGETTEAPEPNSDETTEAPDPESGKTTEAPELKNSKEEKKVEKSETKDVVDQPDAKQTESLPESKRTERMQDLFKQMVESGGNKEARLRLWHELSGMQSKEMTPEQKKIIDIARKFTNGTAYINHDSYSKQRGVLGFHGAPGNPEFGRSIYQANGADVLRSAIVAGVALWGIYKIATQDNYKDMIKGAAAIGIAGKAAYDFTQNGRFQIENIWNKHNKIEQNNALANMKNIDQIDFSVRGLSEATVGMRIYETGGKGEMPLDEFFSKKRAGLLGDSESVSDEDLMKLLGVSSKSEIPQFGDNAELRKNYFTELHLLYMTCEKTREGTIQGALDSYQPSGVGAWALRNAGKAGSNTYSAISNRDFRRQK